MKRFDKGYVYSALLSDFFGSLAILFVLFQDLFPHGEGEEFVFVPPVLILSFLGIYLGFILYRILYYRTSGYELTKREIKCNRGVLFRKRSVLEYRKVHAINKRQTLFQRIFGIAVLTVDSGSTNTSYQAEITIVEKEKTVDLLLDRLNLLKGSGAESGTVPAAEEILLSDRDSLYRFTSKKKILYTLITLASTAFSIALFGALAVFVLGVCKLTLRQNFLGTWSQYLLSALGITVGAMLLSSVFALIGGMIRSFVGYYRFTITKCQNDIRISYGLLEKHTNTFRCDRIKAVKISQSLMQRMLGFAAIQLEVIGYTGDGGSEGNSALGVLVPFCKYAEVDEILEKVLPEYLPDPKQTKSVSYFPFVSWFLLFLGVGTAVVLLGSVVLMKLLGAPASVTAAVAFTVLGAAIALLTGKAVSALLCCRNNGLAINRGKITAYCGSFTRVVTVFPAKNLIAAETVTTPLRKKAGITSLVLHLKTNALSNEIKVQMQTDALSEEVENLLTF